MTDDKPRKGPGNGKDAETTPERRTGVDRRISDSPDYAGPERRRRPRRKPGRQPDKPIKE